MYIGEQEQKEEEEENDNLINFVMRNEKVNKKETI